MHFLSLGISFFSFAPEAGVCRFHHEPCSVFNEHLLEFQMKESTQFSKPETWEPSFTPASSPLTSNPSHTDVPHGRKKTVNYQTVITQKLKCWLYLLFIASLTLELNQCVWGCLPPSFLTTPPPRPPSCGLRENGSQFFIC